MITSVDDYLDVLKKNLEGCDTATIQDALSDAEEYLRNGLETARSINSDVSESDALGPIIEEFGTPEEFAADYKKIEARVRPSFAPVVSATGNKSTFNKLFGIFAD